MNRRAASPCFDADKSVKEAYPNASFFERLNERGVAVRGCRVIMDPIPRPEDLAMVLADLEAEEEVSIGLNGKISHSGDCATPREKHQKRGLALRLAHRRFTAELEFPPNLFAVLGPVHPKFRVLDPVTSLRTHPAHPHLFGDNRTGDAWACPVTAQTTTWKWQTGATLEYLDQCAIWLLKTEVWAATGGRVLSGFGRWIGPSTSHQPRDVLRATDSEGPCRCGSGQKYKECCFVRDLRAAIMRG